MSISDLYLPYTVVAALLLYRRCTGGIGNARSNDTSVVNTVNAKLVWGPFHLPGICGILVNSFALIYMAIAVFFSFWSPSWVVTVQTMNFSVVGTCAVIVPSLVYCLLRAREIYDGPIVELDSSKLAKSLGVKRADDLLLCQNGVISYFLAIYPR